MKDLFCLELKKLAKKRMNIIVVSVCLVLIAILFALPVKNYITLVEGGSQLNGLAAIQKEKELLNTYAGILTDEKVAADIASYQSLFDNPENLSKDSEKKALNNKAFYKYFFPYIGYWQLINGNYTEANVYDSSFSAITNMSLENGAGFYTARTDKIHALLNQTYMDWNYSEQEKSFWTNRTQNTETPFNYSYHSGWKTLLSIMELFSIGIIAICICVAGVFAGEYATGADSIILSARYGKNKLAKAKVLAASTFGLIVLTLFMVVGCGIQLLAFGTDGWNLPIQVLNTITPYNITLLGAVLIAGLTLYLVMLGMVSLTLLFSAKMKSTIPVLVIVIFVMILPMFLGISLTSGVWNRIFALLPYYAGQPVFSSDFFGYFSYPFLGLTFDLATVRVIVYILIALLGVPFTMRSWKRHQVK